MTKFIVFVLFVLAGLLVFLPIYTGIKRWFREVASRIRGVRTAAGQKPLVSALWQGMTIGQLKMAMGKPDQIEIKTGDAKGRQTYRYFPGSNGAFDLKVMVEKGAVVAWFYK